MKAAQIARVSDVRQDSNEAQTTRMDEYIKRNEKLVAWKTYEIKESSSRGERTQFVAGLKEITQEAEKLKETIAVVFETIDRLQRSFKEMLTLDDLIKQGKIELHFVRENLVVHKNSNSSEITRWEMGVLLAHAYILQLSDNVKRQFEQMRRNGRWTGRPPIGYKNIHNLNDVGEVLSKDIVVDECAHLVTKMFELFSAGQYSITTIWLKMNELGLRGRTGQKLSRSEIGYMLNDSFYYGMAHSKKYGRFSHKYERLTEQPIWDKCQEVLAGRRKRRNKEKSKEYALKGLVLCIKCGCLYSPETHKGHVYYSCTNAKHVCKRDYMREDVLLAPIYAVLAKFEKIPQKVQDRLVDELRSLNEGEAVFHQREIARIRTEYDRLQKRKDALLDTYLDASITKTDYDKKLQQINDAQNRFNIEMEEHTKGDHQYHVHVGTVISLCRRMSDIFKSSESSEKRAFLQFLLQNVSADGKKLEFTMRKPFDAVLALAHHPTGLGVWDDVRTALTNSTGSRLMVVQSN